MLLMELLKQILVNLYTQKHNKQVKIKFNDSMKQSVSETAQANSNEANATRIFICVAIFFLAIILLVVFFRKGIYQSSNNQSIDAKNPSHKHYNKNSNRSN